MPCRRPAAAFSLLCYHPDLHVCCSDTSRHATTLNFFFLCLLKARLSPAVTQSLLSGKHAGLGVRPAWGSRAGSAASGCLGLGASSVPSGFGFLICKNKGHRFRANGLFARAAMVKCHRPGNLEEAGRLTLR